MMNRDLLRRTYYLLVGIAFLSAISFNAVGQTVNYVSGALSVDVTLIHPCSGNNGAIRFDIISTEGGVDAVIAAFGPALLFPAQNVPPGGTYTFNASQSLPAGAYDWIVGDNVNSIGSLGDPVSPKLVLNNISPPSVVKDIETNNSSCVTPNGQIQASITGGSQLGADSYSYKWTSINDEIPP